MRPPRRRRQKPSLTITRRAPPGRLRWRSRPIAGAIREAKYVRHFRRPVDPLCYGAVAERHLPAGVSRNLREVRLLCLQRQVVDDGKAELVGWRIGVDPDQLIRALVRQLPQERRVHRAEDRGRGANS
jgi:hypothetical protein